MTKPKILVIDIETKPALAYVWGLFDQNIGLNQLIEPGAPICFAAKFVGEPEIFFSADWTDGHDEMIRKVHALFSEADAVVGYNSDSFDIRKLMGEFLILGLAPPPPLTSIDLYKTVKQLGFQSGKLAYVAPLLGVGQKVKNEGFGLWAKAIEGDPVAQKKMMRYNIGDIRVTEKLYLRIKPYIKTHPFLGMTKQDCGACGSSRVQSRGYRRTKHYLIQRIQCQTCGSWSEGTRKKVK